MYIYYILYVCMYSTMSIENSLEKNYKNAIEIFQLGDEKLSKEHFWSIPQHEQSISNICFPELQLISIFLHRT